MRAGIEVLAPGFFTSIQDAGRPGLVHLGVSPAGAVDADSLHLANRLVGNAVSAAALEMTLEGATLRFHGATRIALAGAPMEAFLDDQWVPGGQTIVVASQQVLTLGRARQGLRTYLAVAGGIDVPPLLGSRSTDTVARLGAATLAAGDHLTVGEAPIPVCRYATGAAVVHDAGEPIRFIRGPHPDYFSARSHDSLVSQRWRVSAASDRSGLRLSGHAILRTTHELPSEGMVTGSIQVPPDGQPIVLLANHGTTGGYPVLGVVAAVDIGRLAQRRPGDEIRFREVSLADACQLHRQQIKAHDQRVVDADEQLLRWRRLLQLADTSKSLHEIRLKQENGWFFLKK